VLLVFVSVTAGVSVVSGSGALSSVIGSDGGVSGNTIGALGMSLGESESPL